MGLIDVLLYQTADGGDLEVAGNDLAQDETPFTAVYLSLFGGNLEDDGTQATSKSTWWGNLDEDDRAEWMQSQTQALLIGMPATTAGLIRIEEAARADLAWLKEEIATEVSVAASMPARNTVRLQIDVLGAEGSRYAFDFTRPWGPRSPN